MATEIRGFEAVRNAAKDFETYSSDLQGDRDVRDYRQLPLEADPPRHTMFREALVPIFSAEAISPKAEKFEALASELITALSSRGGGDICTELALPYVIGCLTIIYNRPQDYEEWLSWGPDVWTAEAYSKGELTAEAHRAHRERNFSGGNQRDGRMLQAYLDRVFDQAEKNLNLQVEPVDIWDEICRLEVGGQKVNRQEMQGIANVLLAGGRDTVIKLVTGICWHLINSPEDRDYLKQDEAVFTDSIAELIRFLSPLAKMERVLANQKHLPDDQRDPDSYVLLSFVSANYDKTVWQDPETIDLRRPRRAHLGFGFGRHACLGMRITDTEAKAFLRALLKNWPNWEFDGEPAIEWVTDGENEEAVKVIDRFNELKVKVA
ncbi:MAG: cytochrome P450 [Micrococcales bacterium]